MSPSKIIHKYTVIDEETGEINEWVNIAYDPTKYTGYVRSKESKKPKKALESFLRIAKDLPVELTTYESGMFYTLCRLIEWEDNFIQKNKRILSIQEFSNTIDLSRNTTLSLLRKLEDKRLLTIANDKNKKVIYMHCRYVWFGHEKNRSDNKLYDLLYNNQKK